VKGFSALKNHGKEPAHPKQSPREKDFRHLEAGILPSMAWATEALNAGQANAGSKAVKWEERDIRVVTYSAGAAVPGAAVKAAGAKVADSADSRPKKRL
jgi:hypothetical protein